jgi:hypothetical protein
MSRLAPGRRRRGRQRRATVATALLGCLALAGCATQASGTPAEQVTTWMSGVAEGSSIGAVEADVRNVDASLSRHDPVGELRSVCALLASDAANGNGNLPSPDQKLTNDLSNAFATAYDAGDDCYNGSGGNQKQLSESARLRTKAMAQMVTAVARITAVTGQVPSTTTTTLPPGSTNDPFSN